MAVDDFLVNLNVFPNECIVDECQNHLSNVDKIKLIL